jgi:hypothetical protein
MKVAWMMFNSHFIHQSLFIKREKLDDAADDGHYS